jgi:hypothetical protein
MSRVVSFGCSHACGCEIEGMGIAWSKTNVESSFGNLVAKHFNKEFKLSARPGASNRQIFLNALEHVQPGDVCLLSWTYFNRENWFAESESDKIRSDVVNAHQLLRVLELNQLGLFQKVTDKFYKKTETVGEQMRAGIDITSQYLKYYDDESVIAVAKAWELYHSKDMVRVFDFLESFHAANAIIKQRGAIAVNFHFSEESPSYFDFLNKVRPILAKPYKHDFYIDFGTPEYCLMIPQGNDLKIFDDYISNQDFIRFYDKNGQQVSFKYWYCETELGDPLAFPGDRMSHLDAKAHILLADCIINKLQSNTGKLDIA